jgi:gas vesicle protein
MDNNARYRFARGLLFGATLGAVTAVLLAPKPGRAVRSDLYARGERLKRQTSRSAHHLIGLGEEAVSRIRDAAQETARGVKRGADRFLRRSENGRYERERGLSPAPIPVR